MDPKEFEVKLDALAETKIVDGMLKVKKLKTQKNPCEWGGLGYNCQIESRRHKEVGQVRQTAHWRHKCIHCGAYINAKTGERSFLKSTDQHQLRQFYGCIAEKN